MRWKFSPLLDIKPARVAGSRRHHDARTIDLLVIVALLALAIGSGWYLADSLATSPSTTAFIVPSQSVHW